mmetsp:Transcript_61101/g.138215  ORF Transcript_61101/g.138215 Transcript_61101/m.138215 type:complete len:273 (-) Transcript_61101:576-1394(-)
MGHLPHVLERVALLAQGVFGAAHRQPLALTSEDGADEGDLLGLDLEGLALATRRHHRARHAERGARPAAGRGEARGEAGHRRVHHALKIVRGGPVVEHDEEELPLVRLTNGARPPLDRHLVTEPNALTLDDVDDARAGALEHEVERGHVRRHRLEPHSWRFGTGRRLARRRLLARLGLALGRNPHFDRGALVSEELAHGVDGLGTENGAESTGGGAGHEPAHQVGHRLGELGTLQEVWLACDDLGDHGYGGGVGQGGLRSLGRGQVGRPDQS